MLAPILTFIAGLTARPINEWVTYILNGKKLSDQKLDQCIEEAFYLTQSLKTWTNPINQIISQICFLKKTGEIATLNSNPSSFYPDETELNKLKYVLRYKISAPLDFIYQLNEIQDDMLFGIRLALREITKPLNPHLPEDELIEEHYQGDALKAAATYRSKIDEKIKTLNYSN